MAEIIGKQTPRAVREHRCWWCSGTIRTGEVYQKWTVVEDGMHAVCCHYDCHRAWQWAVSNIDRIYYEEEVGEGEHRRGCACSGAADRCEGCGVPPLLELDADATFEAAKGSGDRKTLAMLLVLGEVVRAVQEGEELHEYSLREMYTRYTGGEAS